MRVFLISFFLLSFAAPSIAKAQSQAACAIWLCLPGGFPSGCSEAYDEFKHRIREGKSPLPDLSSCVVSPDGKSTKGSYIQGKEYFFPCREGYDFFTNYVDGVPAGICVPKLVSCRNERYALLNRPRCASYTAIRRMQDSFIKMWVDGKYVGQFFY